MATDDYSFDDLASAWKSARESEQKAPKTIKNYEYAINRFSAFLEEYDLELSDIDQGSDLVVPLPTLVDEDENGASTLDGRHLLDYFVLWLRDEEGYATSTCKTTYFSLKPLLDHLFDEGHVAIDTTDDFGLTR